MHARAVLGLIALTSAPSALNAQENVKAQNPPAKGRAAPTTWDAEAWSEMWDALFSSSAADEAALAREAAAQDDAWNVRWANGLKITSPDGAFDIKIGGRIMIDTSWVTADDALETLVAPSIIADGTELRRARVYLAGTVYEDVEYKIEYDFASDLQAAPKDVYIGLKDIPVVGNFRVGHQKEPFGLEVLTSSKYITFLERALPCEAFAPVRNTGLKLQNTVGEDRLVYWSLGSFRNTSSSGADIAYGEYDVTARLTGLPWYEDDGARLLEIGVSGSYNDFDSVVHRTHPENHLIPRYVNTGTIASDGETLVDLESAFVLDSFSLQGEYMIDHIDVDGGGSSTFSGWYAEASWFLTGEHRNFNKGASAWDRVKPTHDFGSGEGSGAWELTARVSDLDLNDGTVAGGEQQDYTVGVNWYLKSNTRVMLNYVHADVDTVGESDSIAMRFQIDF